MQQTVGKGRAGDFHKVCQRKAQAERLYYQPLMQPFRLVGRFFRRAFNGQAAMFQLNIQFFLAETGQRKGDAVVVIVAFFNVVKEGKTAVQWCFAGR
jgi:hypothetical protein